MSLILANNEAEQALIAASFLNVKSLNFVIERLQEHDFYFNENKIMFVAICELIKQGAEGVDIICVKDWLIKNNLFEKIGGDVGLTKYFLLPVLSTRLPEYLKIVKDFSRRRGLDLIAKKMSDQVKDVACNLDDVIYNADNDLKNMRGEITNYAHEMADCAELIQSEKGDYVESGFAEIDKKIYGFFDSEFSILAARPSLGKTSLALNISENIAKNHRVIFFSIEMPAVSLLMRQQSGRTGIEYRHIHTGNITMYQQGDLEKSLGEIAKLNMMIYDKSGITVEEIRNVSILENQTTPISLIVIDYLQLILSMVEGNSNAKGEHTSRSLKSLARELECPILALSQLSRESTKRINKVPVLSDLRDSGAYEQDADNVFFLYEDQDMNTVFKIAKARNAPHGEVTMDFDKKHTRFRN